jgi:hypothetical protein
MEDILMYMLCSWMAAGIVSGFFAVLYFAGAG